LNFDKDDVPDKRCVTWSHDETATMTIKHNQQIQHNRTRSTPAAWRCRRLLTAAQTSARTGNAVSACTSTR
jgi:hypothetical protein